MTSHEKFTHLLKMKIIHYFILSNKIISEIMICTQHRVAAGQKKPEKVSKFENERFFKRNTVVVKCSVVFTAGKKKLKINV